MQKFYKPIFICLFFVIIIIASCITFNNQKNIDKYDYNRELLVKNVNFWGTPTLEEADGKNNKKNELLALFKNKKLQYIVSNDNNHYYRYKYQKINDTSNLLVSQPNKLPLFSRSDFSQTDSILFTPTLCIQKTGNFQRFGSDRTTSVIIHTKDAESITSYSYYVKDRTKTFVDLNYSTLADILSYLKPENYGRIKDHLTVYKKYPIYQNGGENIVDSFFRYRIMHYNPVTQYRK
jgi:hypothetical protein